MLLMIMILWTWGLTPLWVNIVGTILYGTLLFGEIIKWFVEDVTDWIANRKDK